MLKLDDEKKNIKSLFCFMVCERLFTYIGYVWIKDYLVKVIWNWGSGRNVFAKSWLDKHSAWFIGFTPELVVLLSYITGPLILIFGVLLFATIGHITLQGVQSGIINTFQSSSFCDESMGKFFLTKEHVVLLFCRRLLSAVFDLHLIEWFSSGAIERLSCCRTILL